MDIDAAWKAGHIVEPLREMQLAESSAEAEPTRAASTAIDAFRSVHCVCLGVSRFRPRALVGPDVSDAISTEEN